VQDVTAIATALGTAVMNLKAVQKSILEIQHEIEHGKSAFDAGMRNRLLQLKTFKRDVAHANALYEIGTGVFSNAEPEILHEYASMLVLNDRDLLRERLYERARAADAEYADALHDHNKAWRTLLEEYQIGPLLFEEAKLNAQIEVLRGRLSSVYHGMS
jgi:hypothetical protein